MAFNTYILQILIIFVTEIGVVGVIFGDNWLIENWYRCGDVVVYRFNDVVVGIGVSF